MGQNSSQGARMTSPVRVIVVGAGSRGEIYSQFASLHPDRVKVVGVADPRRFARTKLQKQHNILDENIFEDWHSIVEKEKFADAVLICTPDRLHKDPAVAFAKQGYHILLEKPMAELIDARVIGDVMHIQHLEPVGFYHFAHSFVRGNWRNEAESSFALLAKSCHDIDLIHHWAGPRRCVKVSSFGSVSHFGKENKVCGLVTPTGAGNRCLDCSIEGNCPYSASKIYLDRVKQGHTGWPVSVICTNSLPDIESVTEALRTGPYGRCVYECDNDVCSNQGELSCDGHEVHVFDFLTQRSTKHKAHNDAPRHFGMSGHGGADYHLMGAFISAVANNDPSHIRSGPEETLLSHLLVFEAERSRLESRVVYCGDIGQRPMSGKHTDVKMISP
ncbi:hypothetical protein EYF80_013185 [Liparis tanakae]|uniref:Gfo/Idh/MocA-like oxidoreductase N-terminal domain-containing protein n=1 Tax=Liparis tanakae TaxID=230148 RepID=A0A4Z2IFX2_9TELE|nr:hypothetical protein EYF80_013185 [Liparis tanakae]